MLPAVVSLQAAACTCSVLCAEPSGAGSVGSPGTGTVWETTGSDKHTVIRRSGNETDLRLIYIRSTGLWLILLSLSTLLKPVSHRQAWTISLEARTAAGHQGRCSLFVLTPETSEWRFQVCLGISCDWLRSDTSNPITIQCLWTKRRDVSDPWISWLEISSNIKTVKQ